LNYVRVIAFGIVEKVVSLGQANPSVEHDLAAMFEIAAKAVKMAIAN